jgi:hypothetical protein
MLKSKEFWNVYHTVGFYLFVAIFALRSMSDPTAMSTPPCPCSCQQPMLLSNISMTSAGTSSGSMSAALANRWAEMQQTAAVYMEQAQELGGVAKEWASHALQVSSSWVISALSSAQQAVASVQVPQLLSAWLSTLQDSMHLLAHQAAPAAAYGPHLQRSTAGGQVTPLDPWALHSLAHAASRPQLLQQMSGTAPYVSAQQQMQQVMQAAVQGHATLAGTTPAAAAQALQAANTAIAELMSKVQWTLRPLQHQGRALQAPAAANTTCSSQERPAGLAAAAATPAAAVLQQCVLPALQLTQCNVDPAAAGLASCPACDCKCSTLAADGLFKLAAESFVQSAQANIKRRMAPAAAWTTSAIAKAKVRMRARGQLGSCRVPSVGTAAGAGQRFMFCLAC